MYNKFDKLIKTVIFWKILEILRTTEQHKNFNILKPLIIKRIQESSNKMLRIQDIF